MKRISKEKGCMKLQVENLEDLWYLSQVIDPGDLVSGKTTRKIKIGGELDRNQRVVKKTVYIEVQVEKTDFSRGSDLLRVSGTITKGPEDVALGSYHTINVEEFSTIKLTKEKWLKFQSDMIKEATDTKVAHILLVVMDREEVYFAKLKKYGYEFLSSIKGSVQKKGVEEKIKGGFYKEILAQIQEYDKRNSLANIVIASPSFWKEDLLKVINDQDMRGRITLATCSSVGKTAFDELLRRDEVKSALKQDKITKEIHLVEELLKRISVQGNAVYGEKETIQAGTAGAIEKLLLTDTFIHKKREEGDYQQIETLMKTVDTMDGEIAIISGDHEGGKKLGGIGGIAGLTRYRI